MKRQLFRMACVLILCSSTVYASVGSDIRGGTSLSEAMENALKAGESIEVIVSEAIEAGADPLEVVRAAVTLRPNSAPSIVHVAIRLRPGLAVTIMKAVLAIPRIDAASVITAATTAVSGNAQAIADLRFAALEAGVPQRIVDQAIGAAITAPAGPVPALGPTGTTERGAYRGGSGAQQGPVASQWR
jgi:hypothetical protein